MRAHGRFRMRPARAPACCQLPRDPPWKSCEIRTVQVARGPSCLHMPTCRSPAAALGDDHLSTYAEWQQRTQPIAMRTLSLRLLSLLIPLLALLGACATLPPPPPSAPVYAYTDVADTRLGRIAAAAVPTGPAGMSGFRLLP